MRAVVFRQGHGMNSNLVLKLIKYGKVALRHALIIGAMMLFCVIVTRDSYRSFSVGLFMPLAVFISLAIPAHRSKPMRPEILMCALVTLIIHLLIAGTSLKQLLFLLLYALAGILGIAFGYAAKKLERRDNK